MEQNSGRIDPTPRPARSPPASFSRAPVVPAPGRTGKLGHLIRLSRPHAGLGASPLPSRSTANPRSRARTCWPKRSLPISGNRQGQSRPDASAPRRPNSRSAGTGAASIGRLPSPSPGYQTETHKHPPQFNIPSPVGATDWLPWAWPPPPPEPVEESQELPINPSMHALC